MSKQALDKRLSPLEKIKQLLDYRLGMKADAVTESCWQRALHERMVAINCDNASHYYNILTTTPSEFSLFIDYILIPETWFFRDAAALWHCAQLVSQKNPFEQNSSQILVVPCSTGEEAYSLAIAMHEKKVPSHRFHIEAIEISNLLLQKANRAIYNKNSFRGKEAPSYIHSYFIPEEGGFRLNDETRRQVLFHQGNAMESPWYLRKGSYNFIFCRNLLIYLTEDAQAKLLIELREVLAEDGILFVGPSEIEIANAAGFRCVGDVKQCALQKQHPGYSTKVPLKDKKTNTLQNRDTTPKKVNSVAHSESVENKLRRAKDLADEGYFGEALRLCRQSLEESHFSADAHFLIGVIYHAQGQYSKAEEQFTKVIDLQNDHYEALVYLALLLERKGLYERSRQLRHRASQSHNHSALFL